MISSELLNMTGTVYSKTKGSRNSFGEKSFSLNTSINNLKLALQPTREEYKITLNGTVYISKKVAYCNYRTDINPGDILEVNNIRYLIVSVEDDGGRQDHLRMFVSKL